MGKKTALENTYNEAMNEVTILTLDKEVLLKKMNEHKQKQFEFCTGKEAMNDDVFSFTDRTSSEYKDDFQNNYTNWRQKEYVNSLKNLLLNFLITGMCFKVTCDNVIDIFTPPESEQKIENKEEIKAFAENKDVIYFNMSSLSLAAMTGFCTYFLGKKTKRSVIKWQKMRPLKVKIDEREYC